MNDLHGIIFAYRSDANLGELTRPRNTCSLPFGGRYRLVDFMLSNYVNAGITDVGIIVHQSYQSLLDHAAMAACVSCPPSAMRSGAASTGATWTPWPALPIIWRTSARSM